ncbi:threonyl-tRNA synthetase [Xylona heveae TC161]|uniref:threonine--tRNA ligase n=1 Tax=Xylona heveae (strain CBS 132557 / TC161) TaxID=1328760 RepID=A0A165GE83_XYLHT|nr:threonyl-tRNA synthetase [Xylona heveae TC161]KZF22085.1 threonyl-tRNA synthetase [Xylona heveae TC161]
MHRSYFPRNNCRPNPSLKLQKFHVQAAAPMRLVRTAALSRLRLRPLRNVTHTNVQWPALISRRQCASCADTAASPVTPSLDKTTQTPPIPPADHRAIAIDQDLFVTSALSPGSPLFLPNGAHVFNKLLSFLRAQYKQFGFQEVITPTIYKRSLWEQSGHWENYKDDMFEVSGRGASGQAKDAEIGEDEEYGLKPMNCPGHCLLFKSQRKTYRELPVRYADFSPLHRNEISGALSGLTRVRRFHQDDAHIFCRPSQISEEISKTLEFVAVVYKTFNLGPFKLCLSTRPEDHYIGTVEDWERAEEQLKEALDRSGREWSVNEGDGAFYGPKIDIILKDSDGKEHQTATIQLDMQLPQRFQLEYQAPAPELEQKGILTTDKSLLEQSGPVTPVIIHRAIFGSLERFMALLIEHYNGRWPFWLSPRQAIILTVGKGNGVDEYAEEAQRITSGIGPSLPEGKVAPLPMDTAQFLVDIDQSDRPLGKKISEAKRKKYNTIIVVGKRSVEENTLELDVTAQPNQQVTQSALADILGSENAIGNGRSVKLSRDQVYDYFSRVSSAYA